ncbi:MULTISPECIES: hypothetical protein [Photorhabdus]|uniref:hypothetical protein n=1 Tax=Photorhabdus TaxID=29487 RepID=UPI000B0C1E0C|nr:hypothetical protein [Photorhabdus sp. RW14-46]
MAKSEKQWLSNVTLLGCICCRNMGLGVILAEIHHVRAVQDMAQRAAHFSILLHPRYHRAFASHGLSCGTEDMASNPQYGNGTIAPS